MKQTYKASVPVILVVLAVAGCVILYNTLYNVTLEAKDIQFFRVEEMQRAQSTTLRISGLVFKSAMSIRKIVTKRQGDVEIVVVRVGLANHGSSGSFSYDLAVPDTVNEVRFGTSVIPVWKYDLNGLSRQLRSAHVHQLGNCPSAPLSA